MYCSQGDVQRIWANLCSGSLCNLSACSSIPDIPPIICSLTESTANIWAFSSGNPILLNYAKRTQQHLDTSGTNKSAAFLTDTSKQDFKLVILTNKASLSFFSLDLSAFTKHHKEHQILAFEGAPWHDTVSIEAPDYFNVGIKYNFSIDLPQQCKSANAVLSWRDKVIVCSTTHLALVDMSGQVKLLPLGSDEVKFTSVSEKYVAVVSETHAEIFSLSESLFDGDESIEKLSTPLCHFELASGSISAIALSPTKLELVIGTVSGKVLIIGEEPFLANKKDLKSDPGAVHSIAWNSEDCFAVSYNDRGVSVFSSSGTCLFSGPELCTGKSSLVWTSDHYSLILSDSLHLTRLPFLKVVPGAFPALLGSDEVLLWKGDADGISNWEILCPPSHYMKHNAPLRFMAASNSGEQIAVAGTHGVAVYNQNLAKWRVFTSELYEQSIKAVSVQFLGEYVIAILNSCDASLHFYPRTYLDKSSLMGSIKFQEEIGTCLDIQSVPGDSAGFAAISFASGRILVYRVAVEIEGDPLPLDQFASISTRLLDSATFTAELLWKHDPVSQSSLRTIKLWWSDMFTCKLGVLVHTDAKELLLLQPFGEECSSIGTFELFWTKPFNPGTRLNHIWTFGKQFGLEIWFFGDSLKSTVNVSHSGTSISVRSQRRSSLGNIGSIEAESVFSWDSEILPIALGWDFGVVFGLRGRSSVTVSVQPFVDGIFRHLLSDDNTVAAREVALEYKDSPFFFHSLELLLYSAMDQDANVKNRKDQGSHEWIPRVIEFIRDYEEFLEVVASCARKSDFSHWGRVFPLAGRPLQLFDQCIQQEKFHTAGLYLMILQRAEGSRVAHFAGLGLLQHLLGMSIERRREHEELLMEVVRFLQMSLKRNFSNSKKGSELQRMQSDSEGEKGYIDNFFEWFGM